MPAILANLSAVSSSRLITPFSSMAISRAPTSTAQVSITLPSLNDGDLAGAAADIDVHHREVAALMIGHMHGAGAVGRPEIDSRL